MKGERPRWLTWVLWFYSVWFRFGGLLFAGMSALFIAVMAFNVIRDGYVSVAGSPSGGWGALSIVFGTPLLGVAIGIALFKLVPKVELPRRDRDGT